MSAQGQGFTFEPVYDETLNEVEFRLRCLREVLKDDSLAFQRKNIEFLIHYYENGGEIPPQGKTMWPVDSKVVEKSPERLSKPSAMWAEEAPPIQLSHFGESI